MIVYKVNSRKNFELLIELNIIIVLKNGAKVERVSPVGSKSDLEALISRNGGYFYFHFLNI